MRYTLHVPTRVRKDLESVPFSQRKRIDARMVSLAENPRPVGCVKLQGLHDYWRIRVGDFRIVYTIQDDQLLVLVVRIAHRRDVYR